MRFPFPPTRSRKHELARVERAPERAEQPYEDEDHHVACEDCKGSGWYVGLVERRYCPTCDGSGWL